MPVFVDETRFEGKVDDSSPLKDVIEVVRSQLGEADRLVVGVRCDGDDITGADFEAQMERPITSWDRVDLTTGLVQDMVFAAMTQALEMLQAADNMRQDIVNALTEGRNSDGMETLRTCMTHWQQIHHGIVHSLVMLKVDPEKEQIKGKSVVEWVKKPTDRLIQIKDSLQAQDYVMLSDTLQYEFDDVLDAWNVVLTDLKERSTKV